MRIPSPPFLASTAEHETLKSFKSVPGKDVAMPSAAGLRQAAKDQVRASTAWKTWEAAQAKFEHASPARRSQAEQTLAKAFAALRAEPAYIRHEHLNAQYQAQATRVALAGASPAKARLLHERAELFDATAQESQLRLSVLEAKTRLDKQPNVQYFTSQPQRLGQSIAQAQEAYNRADNAHKQALADFDARMQTNRSAGGGFGSDTNILDMGKEKKAAPKSHIPQLSQTRQKALHQLNAAKKALADFEVRLPCTFVAAHRALQQSQAAWQQAQARLQVQEARLAGMPDQQAFAQVQLAQAQTQAKLRALGDPSDPQVQYEAFRADPQGMSQDWAWTVRARFGAQAQAADPHRLITDSQSLRPEFAQGQAPEARERVVKAVLAQMQNEAKAQGLTHYRIAVDPYSYAIRPGEHGGGIGKGLLYRIEDDKGKTHFFVDGLVGEGQTQAYRYDDLEHFLKDNPLPGFDAAIAVATPEAPDAQQRIRMKVLTEGAHREGAFETMQRSHGGLIMAGSVVSALVSVVPVAGNAGRVVSTAVSTARTVAVAGMTFNMAATADQFQQDRSVGQAMDWDAAMQALTVFSSLSGLVAMGSAVTASVQMRSGGGARAVQWTTWANRASWTGFGPALQSGLALKTDNFGQGFKEGERQAAWLNLGMDLVPQVLGYGAAVRAQGLHGASVSASNLPLRSAGLGDFKAGPFRGNKSVLKLPNASARHEAALASRRSMFSSIDPAYRHAQLPDVFRQWGEFPFNEHPLPISKIQRQASDRSLAWRFAPEHSVQADTAKHPTQWSIKFFTEWIARRIGYSKEDFIVTYTGRIAPVKDLELLLEVAKLLNKRMPRRRRLQVLIYGLASEANTFYLQDLQTQIKENGLSHIVQFKGPYDPNQLPEIHKNTHVNLLTSASEVGPYTVLEAMANGIPVVATPVGSTRKFLHANGAPYAGIVVDMNPNRALMAQQLAEALRFLAVHPRKARAMGRRGRERVLDKYTVKDMVLQHLQVFDSLHRRGREIHVVGVPWNFDGVTVFYEALLRGVKQKWGDLVTMHSIVTSDRKGFLRPDLSRSIDKITMPVLAPAFTATASEEAIKAHFVPAFQDWLNVVRSHGKSEQSATYLLRYIQTQQAWMINFAYLHGTSYKQVLESPIVKDTFSKQDLRYLKFVLDSTRRIPIPKSDRVGMPVPIPEYIENAVPEKTIETHFIPLVNNWLDAIRKFLEVEPPSAISKSFDSALYRMKDFFYINNAYRQVLESPIVKHAFNKEEVSLLDCIIWPEIMKERSESSFANAAADEAIELDFIPALKNWFRAMRQVGEDTRPSSEVLDSAESALRQMSDFFHRHNAYHKVTDSPAVVNAVRRIFRELNDEEAAQLHEMLTKKGWCMESLLSVSDMEGICYLPNFNTVCQIGIIAKHKNPHLRLVIGVHNAGTPAILKQLRLGLDDPDPDILPYMAYTRAYSPKTRRAIAQYFKLVALLTVRNVDAMIHYSPEIRKTIVELYEELDSEISHDIFLGVEDHLALLSSQGGSKVPTPYPSLRIDWETIHSSYHAKA